MYAMCVQLHVYRGATSYHQDLCALISSGVGLLAGTRRGFLRGHALRFFGAGGKPTPKLLLSMVQSTLLNQSPARQSQHTLSAVDSCKVDACVRQRDHATAANAHIVDTV